MGLEPSSGNPQTMIPLLQTTRPVPSPRAAVRNEVRWAKFLLHPGGHVSGSPLSSPSPLPSFPFTVLSCLRETAYVQISKPTISPLTSNSSPLHHACPRALFPPGPTSNRLYQRLNPLPLAGYMCVFLEVLPRSERMDVRAVITGQGERRASSPFSHQLEDVISAGYVSHSGAPA